MTLLVADEEDLLAANLDYHLARGVDVMIVTANRAPQEIRDTLRPYAERGVVRVIEEPAQTYAQSEWVTRMARLAAVEHGADWVINCDVDEFYWPEGGDLREVLAAIPDEYGSLVMPVFHFLPRPREEGFFADRMTVRETASRKPVLGTQFAKVAHRGSPDVVVGRGNHEVTGPGLEPLPAWRPIVGLHFPVRSYAQFERKVVRDGLAAANNPDLGSEVREIRERYALYEAGALREEYASGVLDDAQVEAGVRAGELVVDERLKDWFATRAPDASPPSPLRAEWVDALRVEMRRTLHEAELHPLAAEAAEMRRKVRRLEKRLAKSEERLARSKEKLKESERRRRGEGA